MTILEKIEKLIARVNQLPDIINSEIEVSWGLPCSLEAIYSIENLLGIKLPNSFSQFQQMTGGGGIDLFPISSISSSNSDAGFRTVYGDTQYYRQSMAPHKLPLHFVVIQRDIDDNEPFCLDTSKMIDGECPVVLFYHQSSGRVEYIANNFIEFYEKYLDPYFCEAGI
jgi:hypothetical protein